MCHLLKMYSWTGILCLSESKKIGQACNKKIQEVSPGCTKKAAGKANVELAVPAAYDSDDHYPRDTYEPSDVLMINLSPSLTKKGT